MRERILCNPITAARGLSLILILQRRARISARHRRGTVAMSPNGVDASSSLRNAPEEEGPRKLKILMLHGYTQSGPLFRAKTRALEKLLQKSFPVSKDPLYPGGVELFYPTGPIRLQAADIPTFGSTPSKPPDEAKALDAWGWWIRSSNPSSTPSDVEYEGLSKGLAVIRDTIISAGGIDGVIGFSQGGCAAMFVASLLETCRKHTFASSMKNPKGVEYPEGWADLLRIQHAKIGEGLRFAVSYSGFYAPAERYQVFYNPKIATRSLHFIGSLDTVVDETKSTGLAERCAEEYRKIIYHPGGHFVPVGKQMGAVLVGFVRESCTLHEKERAQDLEDLKTLEEQLFG